MSRAATRPPTISRTDGRTRRWTCASSQTAATSRTTSLAALGIAKQDLVDLESLDQRGDRRSGSEDADAVELPSELPRIVVHDAHGIEAHRRVGEDVLQDHGPGVAGAHQEDPRRSPVVSAQGPSAEPEESALEADRAERHDGQSAPEHHGGQGEWARAAEQRAALRRSRSGGTMWRPPTRADALPRCSRIATSVRRDRRRSS